MVFLDYASTNPWPKYRCSDYGDWHLNPNANYAFQEKRMLHEAEEGVKESIGAKDGKAVFGGTASQLVENLMNCDEMYNIASYWTIGSAYEHDSVDRFLVENDLHNTEELEKKLLEFNPDKVKPIVFWQGVNNVVGRVFDVEKIGKLCHKYGAFYICDMTAMIGHAPIPANIDDWCDCAFWSGHKIGTELGIGAMWLSKKFNGWLGDFKLHGTPNVVGAMNIDEATDDACDKRSLYERIWHYADLANCLSDELVENNIEFNVVPECPDNDDPPFAYAINAIRLNGINADALQQYLASKQIYVGLGASACAESHDYRVLNAFGLSDEEASEVIRVSFSESSNSDEVFNLVKRIKEFKEKYL